MFFFQEITPLVHLPPELEDIFQVSEVKIKEGNLSEEDFLLKIQKSKLFSCARCRRIQSKIEGDLCQRCSHVIRNLNSKNVASI